MLKEKLLARLSDLEINGPKRSLGQNFLVSEIVVEKIIKAVQRYVKSEIIEVGPGLGSLTDELLSLEKKLTLIELDKKFVEYWQSLSLDTKVNIIEGDALQIDWSALAMSELTLLVSNLPFQISSSLLIERSLKPFNISTMILMFQKEVAERITSDCRNKEYGLLTVIAQNFWKIDLLCDCAPRDYYPAPNVASRVLVFKMNQHSLAIESRPEFLKFVKSAFIHRRKHLFSNLKGQYFSSRNLPEKLLSDAFEKLGLLLNARAEELTPDQFKELFLLSVR